MQEFKGTKGEWYAEMNSCFLEVRSETRENYTLTSGCFHESGDDEVIIQSWPDKQEAEANFTLIAAAPELLAALKVFTDDYESGYRIMTPNMINQAQQAINKALNIK